jgi:hypothetical protein
MTARLTCVARITPLLRQKIPEEEEDDMIYYLGGTKRVG